jgi:hypothetical protein
VQQGRVEGGAAREGRGWRSNFRGSGSAVLGVGGSGSSSCFFFQILYGVLNLILFIKIVIYETSCTTDARCKRVHYLSMMNNVYYLQHCNFRLMHSFGGAKNLALENRAAFMV